MVYFPPCKINLGLHIISKRTDGYHDLDTCFYPVPWTDILEVIRSDVFSFTCTGTAIPGNVDDNLCVKAYGLLRKDFDLEPVSIHLHKIIPTGAGLGGGSSDAAYTLRLLNQVFDLKLSVAVLMGYAAVLGSDCSFFIQDRAMIGSGRGEILTETQDSLKGKYLVMVKPDIHVSTAQAYAGIRPRQPVHRVASILQEPLAKWKYLLKNDFEETVFENYPALRDIKIRLYDHGAVYASMSGTGSTVFGIFDEEPGIAGQFSPALTWSGRLPGFS